MEASELPKRYAGLLDLLSSRGGGGGPRYARHLPRPPVRQGRDVQLRRARGIPQGARADSGASRSGILTALEIPYRVVDIAVGDLGASAAAEVRLRGVDSEPAALPGADQLLQHYRLPGKTPLKPVPSRARRIPGTRAHAERNCGGCGQNPDRAAGERSEARTGAWNFRLSCRNLALQRGFPHR